MKKKDASFWSEIKSLDERLKRDPDSFCFARLSEVYLKVGLVADALHTARHGVARHPGYLAGQRALAMASGASGLKDESRGILEKVTAAMPEDVEAQKLLASLYVEAGDKTAAVRVYTTVLDFRPEDVQSKVQLESLQQAGVFGSKPAEKVLPTAFVEASEDDILDLDESDIVYDEEEEEEEEIISAVPPAEPEHHDPLSTLTLAELYEQQGFTTKALDIYRSILADDPDNARLKDKISRLEEQVTAAAPQQEQVETLESAEEPERAEDEEFAPAAYDEAVSSEEAPLIAPPAHEGIEFAEPDPFRSEALEEIPTPLESRDFSPLAHNQADNVVDTLDSWLENIRRIKACR